jgi:hypothetical protein
VVPAHVHPERAEGPLDLLLDLLHGPEERPERFVRELEEVRGVEARDDEHVRSSGGEGVEEGDGPLVLVDDVRRDLAGDDSAEQAAHGLLRV